MENEQELLRECKRLDSQGLYRDAVKLLSEAIASKPSARLFHERGLRYEDLGEYEMALEDYSTALSLAPNAMRHWVARGLLLCSRLGRAAEGIEDYRKGISADPSSPLPHQQLSLCYLSLGDPDTACRYAERAIELDAANASSYYCLGICHIAAGQYDSAIEELETALRFEPYSSLNWEGLAGAYRGAGDYIKAIECYEKAIEIEPSAMSYIDLASIELEIGNPKEAIEYLELAGAFELGEGQRLLVDGYLQLAQKQRGNIKDLL